MAVVRILLFFTFYDPYMSRDIPCALVNWFNAEEEQPDANTGMWVVEPEFEGNHRAQRQPVQVIHLETIFRGVHLLPRYGVGFIPEDFHFTHALDAFQSYYVNHFIDHHMHELLLAQ